MYYTIYKITNLMNNKIYIGKHKTLNLNDDYMGSGTMLNRAFNKYGIENFKKEILFTLDSEEEMNQKEVELVNEEFVTRKDTYNICIGGQGGWSYVNKEILTEDDRKRISSLGGKANFASTNKDSLTATLAHLEYLSTDSEYRRNFKEKVKVGLKKHYHVNGTTLHTEETKKKIGKTNSKHQSGKGNSQYGTMWITNGVENKKIKKDQPIPDGWKKGRTIHK